MSGGRSKPRLRRRRVTVAGGLCLLAATVQLGAAPPSPGSRSRTPETAVPASGVAFREVRLFDGERTFRRVNVVVREGRIAAVGESATIPEGVPVIDGAGKTLLPGFIDAHVHAFGDARRDALRFGVTTELEMFGAWFLLAEARRQRESLEPVTQADLWSAGTLATAPGGHGTQFGLPVPTLATPEEAQPWVDARIEEGSDWIKIVREDFSVYSSERSLPTLDAATAAAVIRASHARDKLAVVHVSAREAAREALRDGADGLVHVFQDEPADAELVRLAARRGIFVIPTLAVIAGIAGEDEGVSEDPRLAPWLSSGQRQTLTARFPGGPRAALYRNARESVRRLHAAGVTILAGTDAPNPATAHGVSIHDELVRLVDAGLGPREALSAATAKPADAFALEDRGRIAPGLRADLLLVEGDPTRDIRATRAIEGIWKNGLRVERVKPTDIEDLF